MAFRGQYEQSLDVKNRLNIPARFRPAFASGVVLAKGLDPCLQVWTPEAFESFTARYVADLDLVANRRREFNRYFGKALDTELDSANRVTVPAHLLRESSIEKEVVVVGALEYVEVWERDAWFAEEERLNDGIAESLGATANA